MTLICKISICNANLHRASYWYYYGDYRIWWNSLLWQCLTQFKCTAAWFTLNPCRWRFSLNYLFMSITCAWLINIRSRLTLHVLRFYGANFKLQKLLINSFPLISHINFCKPALEVIASLRVWTNKSKKSRSRHI